MSRDVEFPDLQDAYRSLLEASLTGVFIITGERFIYANHTFEHLVGYRFAELAGMGPWDIVHPEDRERVRALGLARIGWRRPSETYETRMVHRDGSMLWVEVRASPFDLRGQPAALVNMVDISERKRAETALAESESRWSDFFRDAPIGIYRAGPEGRLQLVNPALLRMLGYEPDDAPTPLEREAFDPTYPANEYRQLLDREGEVRGLESAWIRRDDTLLYVREYARAHHGASGKLLMVEGTVEDITTHKHDEQMLQLYASRLQVMQEVDRAILAARSAEEIVRAVLSRLPRLVPCQRAGVVLFDFPRSAAQVVALAHWQDGAMVIEPGPALPLSDFSPPEELHRGPVRCVPDIATLQKRTPLHERLLAEGIHAFLSVPLLAEGKCIGELNLGARAIDCLDRQQQAIAAELGAQLAVALHGERLRMALADEQRRLRQQERLAAVGELADGVAHDFNNLLTAIDGTGDLILRTLPAEHPLRNRVDEIKKVCQRGAALTRNLLVFSRRQELQPERLDLSALVAEMGDMLRPLLGSPIALETRLQAGAWPILADHGQLEQVLLNLAVNARDAMPEGGRLTIETANRSLDARQAAADGLPAGDYLVLTVHDTGCGMEEATREQAFEPFFTTRAEQGGTGLGLATVHGIVTGCGGAIRLDTTPGSGTTFRLFFPAVR